MLNLKQGSAGTGAMKNGQRKVNFDRYGIFVAMVLAGILVSGCDADLSAAEYLERAKHFQTNGEWRNSVIDLKNVLQQNPENSEARWLLGRAYLETGEGAAAEKELRRAVDLGQSLDTTLLYLAKALVLQGRQNEIIQMIQVPPGVPKAIQAQLHAVRGRAYLNLGRLDQAEVELDSALKLEEDLTDALMGRSLLAYIRKQPEEARRWAEETVAVAPKNPEAWEMLGDLDKQVDELEQAERAYEKAIKYGVNSRSALYKRAMMRIALKRYSEAELDAKELLKIAPAFPEGHYVSGLLQYHQQRYTEARDLFEEALRKDIRFAPAYYHLGATHFVLNNLEIADYFITKYLVFKPDSDHAAKVLTEVRLRNNDFSRAEATLSQVLLRNPYDPVALELQMDLREAKAETTGLVDLPQETVEEEEETDAIEELMRRGLGLILQGDRDRGIQELRKVIEIDPELQKTEFSVIFGHMRNREFDEALAVAEALAAKQPNDTLVLNLLAWTYLGNQRNDEARETIEKILKIAPDDLRATRTLVALALSEGRIEQAVSVLESAMRHHPDHLPTLVKLVALKTRLGQKQAAQDLIKQVVTRNPDALKPRLLLARYQLGQGQAADALKTLEVAQQNYTDQPDLLVLLGQAQLALGNAVAAVTAFENLVRLRQGSTEAYYLLARAYYQSGAGDKFEQALKQSLMLNPEYYPAQISFVGLLMNQGKMDAAGELIEKLKKKHPNRIEVYLEAAKLATNLNQPGEAALAYQEALERAPKRNDIVVKLALAQWQASQKDEAFETLESWVSENPSDWLVRYNLANLYLLASRSEEARVSFARVVEDVPNHALALNNLAWLSKDVDADAALEYGQRALALVPESPVVLDTVSVILLNRGETQRALGLLEQAMLKAPGDPSLRYHWALALSKSGDEAGAKKVLTELLDGEARFGEEQEARELLKKLGGR